MSEANLAKPSHERLSNKSSTERSDLMSEANKSSNSQILKSSSLPFTKKYINEILHRMNPPKW